MPDSLYSTSEVARLFDINRVTIYRWVQEGVVKAYKVGKHLKIPASEVERLWKEFGFPGASSTHVTDISKKNRSRAAVNNKVNDKDNKKLVMAVGSDEEDCKFIQEIFAETTLKEECTLVTYADTLEAALAIGKEKPDLLLIKMMESDGRAEEFAKKIKGIHSTVKVIFMGVASASRDNRGKKEISDEITRTYGPAILRQKISKALGLHGRN